MSLLLALLLVNCPEFKDFSSSLCINRPSLVRGEDRGKRLACTKPRNLLPSSTASPRLQDSSLSSTTRELSPPGLLGTTRTSSPCQCDNVQSGNISAPPPHLDPCSLLLAPCSLLLHHLSSSIKSLIQPQSSQEKNTKQLHGTG